MPWMRITFFVFPSTSVRPETKRLLNDGRFRWRPQRKDVLGALKFAQKNLKCYLKPATTAQERRCAEKLQVRGRFAAVTRSFAHLPEGVRTTSHATASVAVTRLGAGTVDTAGCLDPQQSDGRPVWLAIAGFRHIDSVQRPLHVTGKSHSPRVA
eukprot:203536-Prorocentrum_minimum.AAC.6